MIYHIDTDVCVIGAGHAGCEAALACSRLGLKTVIFTMNVDSIAMMPCNPHIGGSSKGHLVREIDAMGGEMAKNIDKTFIQSKMLNISKGPAVHSLRTQADKAEYSKEMRRVLENQENLTIRQSEVTDILTQDEVDALLGKAAEAQSPDQTNQINQTNQSDIFYQKESISAGGQKKDAFITTDSFTKKDNLKNKETVLSEDPESHPEREKKKPRIGGVRIQTGTVYTCKAVIICTGTYLNARCLVGESITETGPGGMQRSTWLKDAMTRLGIPLRRFKTGTPARMDGRTLDYSKMKIQPGDPVVVPFSYSTDPADIQIEQVPCYLTYTNEETHNIIRQNLDRSPIYAGIIEGTGPRYCPSIEDKVVKFSDKGRHHVLNEVYVDGMSSSMPDDVQQRMYRTVPGLENCVIVKNAYAIEYDCINANLLKLSLETKSVDGLFCAGQFNGSNDLVTKDNREPYRMMTSRAEYRLLLRQDNADLRLRKYGYEAGLITQDQYDYVCYKEKAIQEETERLKKVKIGAAASNQAILRALGSAELKTACSLAELICRPELSYDKTAELDPDRPSLTRDITEQVEINIRYEGYIDRQKKQVQQFEKLEHKKIPDGIDYDDVGSLRNEARQKLKEFLPSSIGQASRISGVTPADITVLLIYLEKQRGR